MRTVLFPKLTNGFANAHFAFKMFILLWALCLPQLSQAFTSGQLLEDTLDARSNGMGSAATALAGQAAAIYYNPAGLYTVNQSGVYASFRNEYEDVNSGNIILVLPWKGYGILGFCLHTLHAGNLELTDSNSNPIAELDFILSASFATDLKDYLKLNFPLGAGINIKYFHSILAEVYTGQAMAIDIGLSTPIVIPELSIGMALKNAGTSITYDVATEDLPVSLAAGITWSKELIPDFSFLVSADYTHPFHIQGWSEIGIETCYKNMLKLRTGYRFFRNTSHLTAGFGLNLKSYSLDYAFCNHILAAKHVVSIGYTWSPAAIKPKPVLSVAAKEGLMYFKQGNLIAAHKAWQKALAENPQDPYVRKYLKDFAQAKSDWLQKKNKFAQEQFAAGEYAQAQQVWQQILEIDPDNSSAQKGLIALKEAAQSKVKQAESLAAAYLWIEALSALATALDILPGYPKALKLRAEIIAKIKKQESAKKELLRQTAKQAEELAKKGQPLAAQKLVKSALLASPQEPLLQQIKAKIPGWAHTQALKLKKENNWQAALKLWQQILKVDPNYTPAKEAFQTTKEYYRQKINTHLQTAMSAYRRKDFTAAIISWEKAYLLDPEAEVAVYLVRAYEAQGILYYRQDKITEALLLWEKAQKLDPENTTINKNIRRARNKIKFLKKFGWEAAP